MLLRHAHDNSNDGKLKLIPAHCEFASTLEAQLPDYVAGRLSDADVQKIDEHILSGCVVCDTIWNRMRDQIFGDSSEEAATDDDDEVAFGVA